MILGDQTYGELETWVTETLHEPSFRAKQLFEWVMRGAESWEDMTNISKNLRARLSEQAVIDLPEIEQKYVSELDGTVKYLLRLSDGEFVETVVMHYSYGASICVSSQVGCRMGCSFCASTIGSKKRDLLPHEIVGQVIRAEKDLNLRISHVVFMGMGEPLDNMENVLIALKNMNHKSGLGISMRHITISTCGLVPNMIQLANEGLPITLAVSLHAPNDAVRTRIMPIAKAYPYDALINACKEYIKKTNRRITFEYTLIDGVNDRKEHAEELAERLSGMLCHVNLIPVNPVKERSLRRSLASNVRAFQSVLEAHHVEATVRRELGADINASCGQLRNRRDNIRG